MKSCIHSICDRSARCYTWRSQRRSSPAQVVQRNRHITAASALSSDFDDSGPEFQTPRAHVAEDPMKSILEEFGLDVSMLFRDAHKYEMEQLEADWDEEAGMYDWEKPVESSELCEPAPVCHTASPVVRTSYRIMFSLCAISASVEKSHVQIVFSVGSLQHSAAVSYTHLTLPTTPYV